MVLVGIQMTGEVCYNTDCWVRPPVADSVKSWVDPRICLSNPFPATDDADPGSTLWEPRVTQTLERSELQSCLHMNMVPGKSAEARSEKAGWNQMSQDCTLSASSPAWDIPEHQKQSRPWKKHQVRNGLWKMRPWLTFPHISKGQPPSITY